MIYEIFSASNGAWQLALTTQDESAARQAVESLRISGKTVLIKRDGKRINWRITQRESVHHGQSQLCAAYSAHLAAETRKP